MNDWHGDKANALRRLRRVEGQVRGVMALIEAEEDCEKVLQQFAAVRKALDRAFFDLVACMTRREMAGLVSAKAEAQLAKLAALLARYG